MSHATRCTLHVRPYADVLVLCFELSTSACTLHFALRAYAPRSRVAFPLRHARTSSRFRFVALTLCCAYALSRLRFVALTLCCAYALRSRIALDFCICTVLALPVRMSRLRFALARRFCVAHLASSLACVASTLCVLPVACVVRCACSSGLASFVEPRPNMWVRRAKGDVWCWGQFAPVDFYSCCSLELQHADFDLGVVL